jgi:hypothetical protein
MAIQKEIVDELLKEADPKTVFSSEGSVDEIKKACRADAQRRAG